jgi:excisionase family DNA binding protein
MASSDSMTRARNEFGPPKPAARFDEGEPEVMTAEEVAAYWRCSKRHINNLAKEGKIPGAFRAGTMWRFHRKKIIAA